MKKSFYLKSGILAALATLLLAACASATLEPAQPEAPPAKTEAAGMEKTLFVGPALVDCTGVAPQKCMMVMEDPAKGYQLFYGSIDGFDFQEGYEYELVVRVEKIENPPADASNLKYSLVKIVSQTAANSNCQPGGEHATPDLQA